MNPLLPKLARALSVCSVVGNLRSRLARPLFSHATGITFHHFVEGVRLARAKGLLRNPRCCVCEAACAVGYASADAFRHAFKAREGLAPTAWRTQSVRA